ncbi:tetratricopeptide repeat protein [Nonomuraea sp. NPDC055795]
MRRLAVLLVVVFLVALVPVGAVLGKVPAQAGIAGVAVIVVAALAAVAQAVVGDVIKEAIVTWLGVGNRQRAVLRRCVQDVSRWGKLPRVTDYVDAKALDTRGRKHRELTPYVARDSDEHVDLALAAGEMVLLEGPSAAGKTRTAFEAISRLAESRPALLLRPSSDDALSELAAADVRLRGTVIWLDDLERYLARGLNRKILRQLIGKERKGGAGVLVVATLRSGARAQLESAPGSLTPDAAEVLSEFVHVTLTDSWTPKEIRLARKADGSGLLHDALASGSDRLAVHIAGAPAALTHWQAGRNGVHLVGAAVVSAAVFARSVGHLSPLPADLLDGLHRSFLKEPDRHRQDLPGFAEGLTWGLQRVQDTTSCIVHAGADSYDPFDYLVDQVQRGIEKIGGSAEAWRILGERVPAADLLPFSAAAHAARQAAVAERALGGRLREAPDDGSARFALGYLQEALGRKKEAENSYLGAARLGVAHAMNNLGLLYAAEGQDAQAEEWYRKAVEAEVPAALNNLGLLFAARDEIETAEDFYKRAIRAGIVDALNNLGLLHLREVADTAEGYFIEASEAGVVEARNNLALYYWYTDQRARARKAFAGAIQAGVPEASNNLGVMHAMDGKRSEAEDQYRAALRAGVSAAAHNLSLLLAEAGEEAEAADCRRIAAEGGVVPPSEGRAVVLHTGSGLGTDVVGARVPTPLTYVQAVLVGSVSAASRSSRIKAEDAGWSCASPSLDALRPGNDYVSFLRPAILLAARNEWLTGLFGDSSGETRRSWLTLQQARGVDADLAIHPDLGTEFSFLVLGSTGEGSASQYAAVPGVLKAGRGTAFMVICGNVAFPGMSDELYGDRFFRPYSGYVAPIYAVPGDQDWHDQLSAFMRVFCDAPALRDRPGAAGLRGLLARKPRTPAEADFAAARALRSQPSQQSRQPGPYWVMESEPLLVVGIDTGVVGTIDREQADWLRKVSRDPRPKILLSYHPIYANGEYRPLLMEGGGTVDDVVRDPESRFVSVVSGGVHNYQRYPVMVGDRVIQYIVAGGGGGFLHATHTIPRVDLAGVSEADFRCYPLRGDSLAYFSMVYARRLRARWLRLSLDEATALMTERVGFMPTRPMSGTPVITRDMRWAARVLGAWRFPFRLPVHRGFQRFFSDLADVDHPPFFKSFLHLDVGRHELKIRCLAATGCAEHEADPPLEDMVVIAIGSPGEPSS